MDFEVHNLMCNANTPIASQHHDLNIVLKRYFVNEYDKIVYYIAKKYRFASVLVMW